MNPWIQVTGWTLIHFVWQGGLLAVATAMALWLCRRRSPNVRYAIACLGLAAMLAAPVATAAFLLDAGSLLLPLRNTHSAVVGSGAPLTGLPLLLDAGPGYAPSTAATRIDALLPSLVAAWLAGVILLLARFSGGWWRLRRLRVAGGVQPISPWQSAAERIASRLRVDAAFRVVESTLVDAPAVVGWIRPVILLPVAVLANLTPGQIEALLAHELAHIRRRDYAVNLCQTAAEALLFFHPGVWWVSARIREAREQCCDDVAVDVCGEPGVYAEALAELASCRTRERALALGAANGSLLRRIQRLLRVSEEDEPRAVGGLAILVSSVALAVGIAVLAPGSRASAQPASPGTRQTVDERRVRTTDHFEIHYAPDLDLHAERFAADAERAYEQVSADLRHSLAFRVPIILFRTTKELEESTQGGQLLHPHAGSFADPSRDRILFAADSPADQWLGALTHEVTHVFGFDIIPGTATPQWIAEGLAEYERGAWDPNDLVVLREAVRANNIPKVSSLGGDAIGGDRRLVHAIGHAAFEFIESRWGKAGVRQFLFAVRKIALSGTDRYDGAFQVSGGEFDRGFEDYLKERFSRAVDHSPAARFDFAASLRVEGEITALNFPVADGLACMELWVAAEGDRRRRWAVECGEAAGRDLLQALKPGDRVIVTGAPARQPSTQRIVVQSLERPSDGFSWRARSG
jgi:beta-lactamase regulating signal transducer with metallopeptidase domain